MEVPAKYGIVRAVAFILKLLAWIVLILGIGGGLLAMFNLGSGLGAFAGLGGVLTGVLWFLLLYAVGSILSVLVDIEQETRSLAIRSQR
jgi:hypothetical protein